MTRRRAALLVCAAALACERGPPPDTSARDRRAEPFLAEVRSTWVNRTAGMAARVRWAYSPDSCALLLMSDPAAVENDPVPNDFVFASERDGLRGPYRAWDVAPSPDWRWLAWGIPFTVNAAGRDSVTRDDWRPLAKTLGVAAADLAAASFPTSGMGPQRGVARPVLSPAGDSCQDAECATTTALSWGGWRVRWTADGTRVAFGGPPARAADDAPAGSWTLVDTAGAVAGRQLDSAGLVAVPWVSGPVLDISIPVDLSHAPALRAGRFVVESRGDSIHLVGADRDGRGRERVVGPGIAFAATRDAQYIAALSPFAAEHSYDPPMRLVMYEIAASFDRPGDRCAPAPNPRR